MERFRENVGDVLVLRDIDWRDSLLLEFLSNPMVRDIDVLCSVCNLIWGNNESFLEESNCAGF